MPSSRRARLDRLVATGMSVYPAGMNAAPPSSWSSGMGAVTFHRVRSGKVWGGMGGLGDVNKEQATKRLLNWIRRDNPRLYAAVIKRLPLVERSSGNGLGQTLEPVTVTAQRISTTSTASTADVPWYQKALQTVANLAPQFYAAKQQKALLDINLERAARGEAPLDASQYGASIQVGVDPATIRTTARESVAALTSSPIVWLAGGLLAFMALRPKGRARAR